MIDPTKPNLGGTPVAPWRPPLRHAAAEPDAPPLVSIVTPLSEAPPAFHETLDCVLAQSLQAWEWILVDDGARDPAALDLLAEACARDARIRVVAPRRKRGRSAARNAGFRAARAPFVYTLDPDDLIEATALEKGLWALLSHPEWGFVNGWSVAFDASYELRPTGFEREAEFLSQNFASGRALIRRSVFAAAHGYDESLRDGHEDWDFWLRCADAGIWGGTIPEPLDWFRRKDPPASSESPERIAAFRAAIAKRFPRLVAGAFPRTPAAPQGALAEELPLRNPLVRRNKRLLVVVWSLASDGPGALLLDALALLAKRGWQLTVASVGVAHADAAAAIGRLTSDSHVLGAFLRPADQPRYLRYLVESRRPEWVLLPSGRFGRAVGSYLRARCVGPRWAELRHLDPNDADPAVLGAASAPPDPQADVCLSSDPRDLAAGPRVVAIAPTVDATVWKPRRPPREWMRPQWNAAPDDLVLLFAGRLDPAARPDRIAAVLGELVRRGVPARLVVAAEGAEVGWLAQYAARHGLGERLVLIGPQPMEALIKVLSAADVLFAPGARDTAVVAIRAMACGLPVELCADHALRDPIARHADRIEALYRDSALRAREGRAARERALARFGPDGVVRPLFEALDSAAPQAREPETRARAFEDVVAFFELAAALGAPGGPPQEFAAEQARAAGGERWSLQQSLAARDARIGLLEHTVATLRRERASLEDERGAWSDLTAESSAVYGATIAALENRIAQLEALLRDGRTAASERS